MDFLPNIKEIRCWKCHYISKPIPDMDNYGYFKCSRCGKVMGKLTEEPLDEYDPSIDCPEDEYRY